MSNLKYQWIDDHREPKCAPNPDYPNGIALDYSKGQPSCTTELPYPARRCGVYLVTCSKCDLRVVVTTAGRADDPKSVTVPCKRKTH